MSRFKNDSGFTLMELMAASLIGIILMGVVGSIFFTSLNLFSRSEAIQYKEGSITNVETNLQNAVATATDWKYEMSLPGSVSSSEVYRIGFDSNGNCVEFLDGNIITDVNSNEYKNHIIDQISQISLSYNGSNRTLTYKLSPKEGSSMSVLSGGIVANNEVPVLANNTLAIGNEEYLVILKED